MSDFTVILELIDDCVFSERAATEGGHKSLNYIPGAALLGAAAARLYTKLPSAAAFTLFHSGQVRFGNGLPLGPDDETAWPIPLCWHHAKGEPTQQDNQLLSERIWRLGDKFELSENKQPKQLRSGYVTNSGSVWEPKETMRMKTAIDPTTGRAREAALFGYEALTAGQRFCARISADAAVNADLLQQLRATFTGQLLLGRSRSAEYGRVRTVVHDFTPLPQPSSTRGGRVTLWLLSDLAALDDKGQPTLTPRPEWLGLPPGTCVLEQTFLRTRHYSPWNAHRRGPDLERQVISQGSVLVFDLQRPLTAAEQAQIAATGLGAHREAGLGQVWLNPTWLGAIGEHPQFVAKPQPVPQTPLPTVPEPALITWLRGEQSQQSTRGDLTKQARELAKSYNEILASARKLKGVMDDIEIGPSASQWGGVLAAAKDANTRHELKAKLFEGNACVCKNTRWQDEYWDKNTGTTPKFVDWIKEKFEANQDIRFMQVLAREILEVVKNIERRKMA